MRLLFLAFLLAAVPTPPHPTVTFHAFGTGRARVTLFVDPGERDHEAIVDLPWESAPMPVWPGERFRLGVTHTSWNDTSEIVCEVRQGDRVLVSSVWTCDYEAPSGRRGRHR